MPATQMVPSTGPQSGLVPTNKNPNPSALKTGLVPSSKRTDIIKDLITDARHPNERPGSHTTSAKSPITKQVGPELAPARAKSLATSRSASFLAAQTQKHLSGQQGHHARQVSHVQPGISFGSLRPTTITIAAHDDGGDNGANRVRTPGPDEFIPTVGSLQSVPQDETVDDGSHLLSSQQGSQGGRETILRVPTGTDQTRQGAPKGHGAGGGLASGTPLSDEGTAEEGTSPTGDGSLGTPSSGPTQNLDRSLEGTYGESGGYRTGVPGWPDGQRRARPEGGVLPPPSSRGSSRAQQGAGRDASTAGQRLEVGDRPLMGKVGDEHLHATSQPGAGNKTAFSDQLNSNPHISQTVPEKPEGTDAASTDATPQKDGAQIKHLQAKEARQPVRDAPISLLSETTNPQKSSVSAWIVDQGSPGALKDPTDASTSHEITGISRVSHGQHEPKRMSSSPSYFTGQSAMMPTMTVQYERTQALPLDNVGNATAPATPITFPARG